MHRFVSPAVVASVGVIAFLASCSNEPPKYDPEPYRTEIEAIENLVTKAEKEDGDGGRLATFVADLAGALGRDIENQRRREVVMNLLMIWSEGYSVADSEGLEWDLAEARASWKGYRDRLFEEASWFKPM